MHAQDCGLSNETFCGGTPDDDLPIVWNMPRIKRTMEAAGSHWFEPSTMRFFRTRLGKVFQGPGGIYFVTSEQPPHGPRRYSVRRFDPAAITIETVGAFCALSYSGAVARAARLAKGGA